MYPLTNRRTLMKTRIIAVFYCFYIATAEIFTEIYFEMETKKWCQVGNMSMGWNSDFAGYICGFDEEIFFQNTLHCHQLVKKNKIYFICM